MNKCIHCESVIDDPKRSKFCSNWCAKDHVQPEDNRSLKVDSCFIKDGVYEED